MPYSTDVNDIEAGTRVFIDTMNDWVSGESRRFYYTRHEKVTKVSQRTGNTYVMYYIYLLKTVGEKVGGEETLSIFASKAASLKRSGLKQFQEVTITRTVNDDNDTWEFVPGDKILPEAERPELEEYPELNPPTASPVNQAAAKPAIDPNAEINIDDIPF